jgi:hypothetical protein
VQTCTFAGILHLNRLVLHPEAAVKRGVLLRWRQETGPTRGRSSGDIPEHWGSPEIP